MREVTGAMSEAINTASRRPRTWSLRPSGPLSFDDCRPNESSIVTKSSSPRSAVKASDDQYAALSSSVGRADGSRHEAGWTMERIYDEALEDWGTRLPGSACRRNPRAAVRTWNPSRS